MYDWDPFLLLLPHRHKNSRIRRTDTQLPFLREKGSATQLAVVSVTANFRGFVVRNIRFCGF